MARVLLLMPKVSYRAEPFLAAARALGIELRVGSDRCHRLAERWGTPLALDFREPSRAVEQVLAHVRDVEEFDAVVATDDRSTDIACLVAAALGLQGNHPDAAYAARNKGVMRARLAAAAVPSPPFRVLAEDAPPAALAAAADEVGWPVVVKPVLMSGSRGVIRADDLPRLLVAAARVRAILHAPDVEPSPDPAAAEIIVERYLHGGEISLEGILRDGLLHVLAVFDKPDPLDGPFFEESIYVTPSRLAVAAQEEARDVAERAAAALGLAHGPVHVELRLTSDGVAVIEVAGRSIGGLCSRTLELGTGQTLEDLILRDAIGETPPLDPTRGASGVLMLPIPERGLLRGVSGIEEAEAIDGVEAVEITAPMDHEIVPLPEGSSYLGFVFARAATPAAVELALRRAGALIEPRIAPNLAFRP